MSKAISIRIPDDLASKLSDIAEKTERPKSFHVQKALQTYLAEMADTFPCLAGKFAELRKFIAGDYRAISTIIEDTALILRISHRRESYR
jgi:predicted DNA-binding protein